MGSNVLTVMSPPLPMPDRTLVSRARDGEAAAREQLARDAGRSAYVFALQMTGQPEVAQDIAQESLVRFFRNPAAPTGALIASGSNSPSTHSRSQLTGPGAF